MIFIDTDKINQYLFKNLKNVAQSRKNLQKTTSYYLK